MLVGASLLYAYSSGPPSRSSGVPGEHPAGAQTPASDCTACHLGTAVNGGGGKVEIAFPSGLTYAPGVKQTLRLTITDSAAKVYGFQLTARMASDERVLQAGSLAPAAGESNIQVICADDNIMPAGGCPAGAEIESIEHVQPRAAGMFNIDWTPPATATGPVNIYVAAAAANGDFAASGDHIYTAKYTLTVSAGPPPAIAADRGVVSAANYIPGLTPGAWVAIFGANLAPESRRWNEATEIVNGLLPTSLDRVTVTIGGKPAAISYISPTQINVQVPADISMGQVPVAITTAAGASTVIATAAPVLPGFFTFDGKYVAAQHAPDSTGAMHNIGQTNLFGPGTAPAHPGEIIVLYGTGFGQTTRPGPTPTGVVVTTANQIDTSPTNLTVTIGGQPAAVQFAGITIAGVWQLNVVVPLGLAPGDYPVAATVQGQPTQTSPQITIQ